MWAGTPLDVWVRDCADTCGTVYRLQKSCRKARCNKGRSHCMLYMHLYAQTTVYFVCDARSAKKKFSQTGLEPWLIASKAHAARCMQPSMVIDSRKPVMCLMYPNSTDLDSS